MSVRTSPKRLFTHAWRSFWTNAHIRNAGIGVVVAGMLFGLGFAGTRTTVGGAVTRYLVATVIHSERSPSPSPVVGHDAATGALTDPTPTPVASPEPTQLAQPTNEPFPAAPAPVAPAPGQPIPPRIPETMVNVGVTSISPPLPDRPTCQVGCGADSIPINTTIVWAACFQGGFTGSTVELCGTENTDPGLTFTWADGHVGSTDPVTYSTGGSYRVTVSVTETYNGHIYAAGSNNSVPITVYIPTPIPSPIPSPLPSPLPSPVPSPSPTPSPSPVPSPSPSPSPSPVPSP